MAVYAGPEIVNDGLILSLDAANAKSYPGSGTTWTDLSPNQLSFTLWNSPNWNTQSFTFDGTNQYAAIGSSVLNLSPTADRTVEIWAKVNTLPTALGIGGLFGDRLSTSGVISALGDGKLVWSWDDSNTGSTYATTKSVVAGEWFQLVVLLRNSYYVTYYVNGVLDKEEFRTTDTASTSNIAWSIGRQNRDFTGQFYYLHCSCSLAMQYSRLLNAQEIRQNFQAFRGRFGI